MSALVLDASILRAGPLARLAHAGPASALTEPSPAARGGAALLFFVAVALLVWAYRRLRERAREEEASALLLEEFANLERPSGALPSRASAAPSDKRAPGEG